MNRNFAGNVGTGGAVAVDHGIPTDPLLTDRESAAMIGCGRSTFWRYVNQGIVPKPLKIGGMSRWRQSEIGSVIEDAAAAREVA